MPSLSATGLLFLLLAACDPVSRGSLDGAELFNGTCAHCHGQDGTGVPEQVARLGVPNMTDAKWQAAHTDDDIRRTVHKGSKSKKMPAFGAAFSEAQLGAVIVHVRWLARSPQALR